MGEAKHARYLAEFVGTFLLVLTVGCNVNSGNAVFGVTSIACVLMVVIYAMGGVSGGNFNPAVSCALAASGTMAIQEAGIYCGVQILAGILGALCYSGLFWETFNLAPKAGFGWWEMALAEIFYSCMLVFVVLNVAGGLGDRRRQEGRQGSQFYGLAIGFVVIAGGYGAGAISGGCFNPAVAIGIDVASAGLGFGWSFAYTGFELLGAAIAAALYRLVREEDYHNTSRPSLQAMLISEFLGTFMLVLTVGLNVLGGSPAGAWSIAASLMCMIFALGDVSGAHFNPAVTVAILASGRNKVTPRTAGFYVAVQVLAGILATFIATGMHHGATWGLGPQTSGYNWAHVGVAEVMFTFVLCYVVLSVATLVKEPKYMSEYFGLAIGSCVTVGGLAIGKISGGSLNPAVSVGISSARLIDGGVFWPCLAYTCFELVGAALAAGVFRATHAREYAKSF